MKRMVLLGALVLLLAGCTDAGKTVKVLKQQGYKNIETTGYRWFSCNKNDGDDHTGFRAISPTGQQMTGTVCSCRVCLGGTTRVRLD